MLSCVRSAAAVAEHRWYRTSAAAVAARRWCFTSAAAVAARQWYRTSAASVAACRWYCTSAASGAARRARWRSSAVADLLADSAGRASRRAFRRRSAASTGRTAQQYVCVVSFFPADIVSPSNITNSFLYLGNSQRYGMTILKNSSGLVLDLEKVLSHLEKEQRFTSP